MDFRDMKYKLILTSFFSILLFFLFPILLHATNFTVNNTADKVDANLGDGLCADDIGNCTLRAAIQEANSLVGANIINVSAGTYVLTIQGVEENAAATGDLDIIDDLTIIGEGVVCDGGGAAAGGMQAVVGVVAKDAVVNNRGGRIDPQSPVPAELTDRIGERARIGIVKANVGISASGGVPSIANPAVVKFADAVII